MRKLSTAVLSAALVLGLLAAQPAEAKVYKMNPDERAAALKEKRSKRSKAKKEGKAAPGDEQGGWVEVKPGQGVSKKNRKAKVDEIAKQAEDKGKKKSRHKADEAAAEAADKAPKKAKKGKKAAAEEPVVEKKHKAKADKAEKAAKPEKPEKSDKASKSAKAEKKGKKGKRSASHGDKAVGSGFGGERKVSASSAEVRREGVPAAGQKGDDLSGYSVARPGQDKAPAVPEVRHEIQTGPLDSAKPLGTEQKSSEGRF